jgi:solute carrier family 25 S-adenosylmethionine transporter 26
MLFQQLKDVWENLSGEKPGNEANFGLGAVAAALTVCMVIPLDTVKTRLVTQGSSPLGAYTGVLDCLVRAVVNFCKHLLASFLQKITPCLSQVRIFREEGLQSFYRSLPARLASVVPMIAIQFGTYEMIKSAIFRQRIERYDRLKQQEELHIAMKWGLLYPLRRGARPLVRLCSWVGRICVIQ